MKITEVLEKIQKYEIVPVASFSSVEDALKISEGLMNKNLPIIEITFRTGDAPLFIQSVKKEFSSMLVGAGSVVKHSIPENSVAVGNPAKVICTYEEYKRKRELQFADSAIFDESFTIQQITEEKKQLMKEKLSNSIGFVR
jgi:hypothetical protein